MFSFLRGKNISQCIFITKHSAWHIGDAQWTLINEKNAFVANCLGILHPILLPTLGTSVYSQGPPPRSDVCAQDPTVIWQTHSECHTKLSMAFCFRVQSIRWSRPRGYGSNSPSLPQVVLTSSENQSPGKQRQTKQHWNDPCGETEWQWRSWAKKEAISRLVFM